MTLTPTAAPILPADVLAAGRAPILVTGASGTLGRAVVEELLTSHVPVRALVHSTPVTTPPGDHRARLTNVPGDVATGAGLDAALDGVSAVVHCAGDPRHGDRVDVQGTRNLVMSMDAWAPSAHLVAVSIVGCWENPLPYYRAKADEENIVESWGGRASIVRATQFHPFARDLVSGAGARVLGGLDDISVSPIDPRWVAAKLVDVALIRTTLPEPMQLAGPETFTLAELTTLTAHLRAQRPARHVDVPVLGGTMRAFARGTHLASEDTQIGGRTYAEWFTDDAGADAA